MQHYFFHIFHIHISSKQWNLISDNTFHKLLKCKHCVGSKSRPSFSGADNYGMRQGTLKNNSEWRKARRIEVRYSMFAAPFSIRCAVSYLFFPMFSIQGGVYTILVIGEWPVLFLVKRELAIFKNVNCDWINSGDW